MFFNGIRRCLAYIDKHILTLLNIDTLIMFNLHWTCSTSFDGSVVYFIVTGIKNAFQ